MYMLDPDLLAEAHGLPLTVTITGLVLGLLLWCLGWWGHRFWIVLATTASAGIIGLSAGPISGLQPLVVALLLAVAAGAMALHLSRLVVFAWMGLGMWVGIHAVIPALQEPLICFLIGGMLGLLLFRFWTMVLTSFSGSLLIGYSTLLIVEKTAKFQAEAWAEANAGWLNWAVAGTVALGWLMQFLLERLRIRKELKKQEAEEKERQKEKEKKMEKEKAEKFKKRTWWDWANQQLRRAG